MLYHLALFLKNYYSFFNIIYYTSFRAIAALLTSLFFSFSFSNWFIKKTGCFKTSPREYTPSSHQAKINIPTMGGLFIIANVIFSVLLWNNLTNSKIWIALFTLISFGIIGLIDDLKKINKQKGLSATRKFCLQIICALGIAISTLLFSSQSTLLYFPFFKNFVFNLGWFFIPWAVFVLVGTSNAVNLTDGLDGLAIGSLISNFSTFAIISFLAGNYKIATYLNIPFAGTSEIAIFGAALVGASLGFLWYNSYPAQIFMGDIGSLSLGACLALIALLTKQEILLIITGGLFVVETISVIVQVLSYKFLGRRLFKMAPIHHHFELIGWPESKIAVRFGIISIVLCLIGLMTLKIR